MAVLWFCRSPLAGLELGQAGWCPSSQEMTGRDSVCSLASLPSEEGQVGSACTPGLSLPCPQCALQEAPPPRRCPGNRTRPRLKSPPQRSRLVRPFCEIASIFSVPKARDRRADGEGGCGRPKPTVCGVGGGGEEQGGRKGGRSRRGQSGGSLRTRGGASLLRPEPWPHREDRTPASGPRGPLRCCGSNSPGEKGRDTWWACADSGRSMSSHPGPIPAP